MNRAGKSKTCVIKGTYGFTLVEILMAVAIALIVISVLYLTFDKQQDSYLIQSQLSATQQNLRGAMQRITRDLQMAGYYTNFVSEEYTMDWDGLDGEETIKPVIYGRYNVNAPDIKTGSDLLVVVLADKNVGRSLTAAENISAGDPTKVPGSVRNIIGASGDELRDGYYGLLVKRHLNRAEMFRVTGAEGTDFYATLRNEYDENDMIFRVDIFSFFVDQNYNLCVKNLARKKPVKQTVAENIENLKVRYILPDGTRINSIECGKYSKYVRAVEVSLLGRTAKPIRRYADNKVYTMAGGDYQPDEKTHQRRLLSTTILTRNIGL